MCALPVALWLISNPAPHSGGRIKERSISVDATLISLIAFFYFLYVGAEASFGGWVFTYTLEMGLSGSASAAYLTSAFWGALTCGRLLIIPIASRARPRTILLACLIGCLTSVGIILIFPGSINAVWIGTIGMGLSMAPLFPTMFLIAERRMVLTGKITRWFFVGAGTGGMFLPWLIGQLFVEIGPKITMQLIAIDLMLALILLIRILGYPLKDQDAQIQTLITD
jgi:fucose permease